MKPPGVGFVTATSPGRRIGPHTVTSTEGHEETIATRCTGVAVYARLAAAEHKNNLDSQAERRVACCIACGYQIAKVVKEGIKEVGSGINDARP